MFHKNTNKAHILILAAYSVPVLVRLPYLEGCKVSIRSMTQAMGWDLPVYKSTISFWNAEKTQTKSECLNAEEPTVLWQSADI